VICKLFERVVKEQILNYLRLNNLISQHQHGFLSISSSICTQLLETINDYDWSLSIRNRWLVDAIYFDFSKSSDSVSHSKLTHKLKGYGLSGKLLIRPPVRRPSNGRSYKMLVMFLFFLSPGSRRATSTDRRETLPHDRKLVRLDKFSPKIRGHSPPPKKMGAKNMQNFERFCTTSDFDREYLRSGARYRKSERHVISSDSFRVQPKRSGEQYFGPLPENSM